MRPPTRTRVRPRVAEVVAVLSMATDLGLGLPMEHAVRTCLISMELGRRLGMSSAELGDLYYLTLLRMLGCTSGSAQYAYFFGDEVKRKWGEDVEIYRCEHCKTLYLPNEEEAPRTGTLSY